jgi:hypothetical protein
VGGRGAGGAAPAGMNWVKGVAMVAEQFAPAR